jgi:hypothetical protein
MPRIFFGKFLQKVSMALSEFIEEKTFTDDPTLDAKKSGRPGCDYVTTLAIVNSYHRNILLALPLVRLKVPINSRYLIPRRTVATADCYRCVTKTHENSNRLLFKPFICECIRRSGVAAAVPAARRHPC